MRPLRAQLQLNPQEDAGRRCFPAVLRWALACVGYDLCRSQQFVTAQEAIYRYVATPLNRLLQWVAMRAAKNWLSFLASAVAIFGLLYSPVCILSCAISDCASIPAPKVSPQSQQPGHCHHRSSKSPSGNRPQGPCGSEPRKPSNSCPGHTEAITIVVPVSSFVGPFNTMHQDEHQPVPAFMDMDFAGTFGPAFAKGRSLRAPPSRAVISVYRI